MRRFFISTVTTLVVIAAPQFSRANEIICHASDTHFVVVISPYGNFETEILAGDRHAANEAVECSAEPATRRRLAAPGDGMVFEGLTGKYAALSDTSEYPSVLVIYDLDQTDPVFSEPATRIHIGPDGVSYLEITDDKATPENCPDHANMIAQGNGVLRVQQKLFNPVTAKAETSGSQFCIEER